METYRASSAKRAKHYLLVGGVLALTLWSQAGLGTWLVRIVLTGLLAAMAYSQVIGTPRLSWTPEMICYTGLYGRRRQLLLADYGSVWGYSMHSRGGRVGDYLVLRPLAGGKNVTLDLTLLGLEEAEVKALGTRINRAPGHPESAVDRLAQEAQVTETAWSFAAMMLLPPLGMLAFVLVMVLMK
ncbi:hypothetical protein [Stagnihabitans tardus]|uniref:PH domain-containing protein n=1 Tax=Stagnihabitans tardus TaxID=2699202 RepID=A0AAE5BUN7_9RHOB|nr:hypothetical protein [Stagnihabitans tardus]NBZ87412.1 hypothetical protein [Stagnihabitans tardus]